MTAYVCDASVVFRTLVTEVDTGLAERLIGSSRVNVPDLLYAEIVNAIRTRVRRGTIAKSVGLSLIQNLAVADFDVHAIRPHMLRAFMIADAIDHPAYDCLYLALAESLNLPLVTADRRFLDAIRRADFLGVDVRALAEVA
jgi:predicted nucleic acid-binding protein